MTDLLAPKSKTPPDILEMLQRQVDQGTGSFAQMLYQSTGRPPKCVLVVAHFDGDVIFGTAFAPAQPQAQMNLVDTVVSQLRRFAETAKATINLRRRGGQTDA